MLKNNQIKSNMSEIFKKIISDL